MRSMRRREFVRQAGMVGAGLALIGAGCAPKAAAPAAPQEAQPAPTAEPAYMAVVRGSDPEAITRAAISALGGMQRFVKADANVIIKPNICVAYHTEEYAATTNPIVVATLVTMCREAGAKRVRVMDMPFGGTPEAAYEISGIAKTVKAAGGEMEIMSPVKYAKFDIPDGHDIKEWSFYRDILEADLVINVPIAKTHSLARLSLGGKNMLGVISQPGQIHWNLGQRVADLVSRVRPALTLIDAVRILTANGPTGGSLNDVKRTDMVIASHDVVAADAYATRLFEMKPEQIAYIKAAAEMGLGTMELGNLKVEELSV